MKKFLRMIQTYRKQTLKISALAGIVLLLFVGSAQAALVVEYWFQEAEAIVHDGTGGGLVLDFVDNNGPDPVLTEAYAESLDYGCSDSILEIIETPIPDGSLTIDLFSEVYLETFTQESYAEGRTYFQIFAYIIDQSYEFDLTYDLIPPSDSSNMQELDHYVVPYAGGPILDPNQEWYLLAYGDLHYSLEGQDEWDIAATDLTLTLTPVATVPVPCAFLLLGSGLVGVVGIRRRFSPNV